MIEENVWRAIRYGLDGELLDLDRAEPYPASEALDRLLDWSAPVRTELGIEVALPPFNGAQRQRRMTAGGEPAGGVRRGRRRDPRHVCCERSGGDAMSSEHANRPRRSCSAPTRPQLERLRVEHVLLDNVVALANLGMRRTGLAPGTEDERDPDQVRLAIESIRAMLPLVEQAAPAQVGAIRDAVSQLQLAFVRIGGQPPGPSAPESGAAASTGDAPAAQERPPKSGEPGPAQRSGRPWRPGQ